MAFVQQNQADFKQISDVGELLKRVELQESEYAELMYLSQSFEGVVYELPPERQDPKVWTEGHVHEYNAIGRSKIVAVLANVDKPQWKRRRQYINPDMDSIQRDPDGNAVVLLPLLPLNERVSDNLEAIYTRLVELGVRESFCSFIYKTYRLFEFNHVDFSSLEEATEVLDMLTKRAKDEWMLNEGWKARQYRQIELIKQWIEKHKAA